MRIKVQFHGLLAEWIGTGEAIFALHAGASFADLMTLIGRRYGTKMPEQLWDKENDCFMKAVWAMRGDKRIGGPKESLKEGEVIRFLLMQAGG